MVPRKNPLGEPFHSIHRRRSPASTALASDGRAAGDIGRERHPIRQGSANSDAAFRSRHLERPHTAKSGNAAPLLRNGESECGTDRRRGSDKPYRRSLRFCARFIAISVGERFSPAPFDEHGKSYPKHGRGHACVGHEGGVVGTDGAAEGTDLRRRFGSGSPKMTPSPSLPVFRWDRAHGDADAPRGRHVRTSPGAPRSAVRGRLVARLSGRCSSRHSVSKTKRPHRVGPAEMRRRSAWGIGDFADAALLQEAGYAPRDRKRRPMWSIARPARKTRA